MATTRKADLSSVTDKDIDEYLATLKAVKEWIERVLSIKLEGELTERLRNGIVLCYLAREIDPGTMPLVHGETSSAFRLRENVQFFLAALEDLGLPRHTRFLPYDLDSPATLPRVVECLVALAREAEKRGFAGGLMRPPAELVSAAARTAMKPDALEALKASIFQCRPRAPVNRGGRIKVSESVIRRQLALYAGGANKIAMDRVERGFTRFQAIWRGHKARKAYSKIKRDAAYRHCVVKEILETEESYSKNLAMCIELFVKPMHEACAEKNAAANGFVKENVYTVFSDIEVLYKLSEELLRELRPVVEGWNNKSCLSKTFKNMVGFLPLYTNYVTNYDKALTLIAQLRKKEKFVAWLASCVNNPTNTKRLDLEAYIIQPVQRVPRYLLLLSDLSKHTWETHPDHDLLKDTIARVQKAALVLNEKKRQAENLVTVLNVDANITAKPKDFVLISPSRRLVKDAVFKKKGKTSMLRLMLFNDIVLAAKPESGAQRFKYVFSLPANQCQLAANPSSPEILDVIKLGEKKPVQSLVTSGEKERDEWVKIFETTAREEKDNRRRLMEMREKLHESVQSPAPASPDPKPADVKHADPTETAEQLLLARDKGRKGMGHTSAGEARRQAELAKVRAQRDLVSGQLESMQSMAGHGGKKKADKETMHRAKAISQSLSQELEQLDKKIAELASPEELENLLITQAASGSVSDAIITSPASGYLVSPEIKLSPAVGGRTSCPVAVPPQGAGLPVHSSPSVESGSSPGTSPKTRPPPQPALSVQGTSSTARRPSFGSSSLSVSAEVVVVPTRRKGSISSAIANFATLRSGRKASLSTDVVVQQAQSHNGSASQSSSATASPPAGGNVVHTAPAVPGTASVHSAHTPPPQTVAPAAAPVKVSPVVSPKLAPQQPQLPPELPK